MRNLFLIFVFLLFASCGGTKTVHWCGDHQCVNEKERKAYFAKTMIIEIREIDSKDKKLKEEKKEQKKILKQARLDEKKRKKEKKRISKQARLDEKKRKKEQKKINKKAIEKKAEVKSDVKVTNVEIASSKITNKSNNFSEISNKILSDSLTKPYPDINDIID